MILSSTVEEMRIFHNPCDLSMCFFGRGAHTNYLDANVRHVLTIKSQTLCGTYSAYFFYNLDKFFAKSFNYTEKDHPECKKYFE